MSKLSKKERRMLIRILAAAVLPDRGKLLPVSGWRAAVCSPCPMPSSAGMFCGGQSATSPAGRCLTKTS